MGKLSRDKGKRGEREAAAEIGRLFNVDAARGRQYSGNPDAPDIRTSIHKVHFEVKRVEKFNVHSAVNQAVSDAGDNIPVVLHKSNRHPWLAVVRLDDLPALSVQLYLTLAQKG